jgi:putative acetyltransferase
MPFVIRDECDTNVDFIRRVHARAFPNGEHEEARLVDRLRTNGRLVISLIAKIHTNLIIGHIALSPVEIELADGSTSNLGLAIAPLAVVPEFQNRGVGAALVHEGIRRARQTDATSLVVLGDPNYYARFGFRNAKAEFKLRNEYAADQAFQALELKPGALRHVAAGLMKYAQEFRELTHD